MLTTTKLITWLTALENKEFYEYHKEFVDDNGQRYVFMQDKNLVNVWRCEELGLVIKANPQH